MKTRLISMLAVAGLATAIAVGTGCVHKPTLELHSAQINGIGLAGVGMNVVVRVNNTNSFDVQVRDVNVQVTVAGFLLPPIQYSPNRWLGSDQTTLVDVPVVIPWAMVPGLLTQTLGKDKLKYHVKGTADVTATRLLAVQRNNYPIEEDGEVPRATLVAAARLKLPYVY